MASETRGVPEPIASDMCLIGDTSMPLQTQSLPKKTGPNYGQVGEGPNPDFRVQGKGEKY